MDSRYICCSTARTWSFITGYLRILANIVTVVEIILIVLKIDPFGPTGGSTQGFGNLGSLVISFIALPALAWIVDILLVVGIHKNKWHLLLTWIFISLTLLVVELILIAVGVFVPVTPLIRDLLSCVFTYAVELHRSEMKCYFELELDREEEEETE